jgi:hypothetical protein
MDSRAENRLPPGRADDDRQRSDHEGNEQAQHLRRDEGGSAQAAE